VHRSTADLALTASGIRDAVRRLDRTQVIGDIRTLEAVLSSTLVERRFLLWLIGAFTIAALMLAVIGLYGVVSYVVAQRSRDIGLRVALGAARSDIRALVIRIGMTPVVAGLVVGVMLVVATTRAIEGMLVSVQRLDVPTIAGAALTLFGAALIACYVPARRATRLDPVVALRAP
jgi:putative ABC transport system permease protein